MTLLLYSPSLACMKLSGCSQHDSGSLSECEQNCQEKICPECNTTFGFQQLFKNQELIRSFRMFQSVSATNPNHDHVPATTLTPSSNCPSKKSWVGQCDERPLCQFCDVNSATIVCDNCVSLKSLCDSCFDIRHKKSSMQNHTPHLWRPQLATRLCQEHGQECLMYCTLHRTAICTLCTFGAHKGHSVVVISDEIAYCRKRVHDAVLEVEKLTQEVQAGTAAIATCHEQVTGRSLMDTSKVGVVSNGGGTSYATIQAINARFDALRDGLEARRRHLIEGVYEMTKAKSATLGEQMDACSVYVARNYSVCFQTKHTLENESAAYILEHEQDILVSLRNQKELRELVSVVPAVSSEIRYLLGDIGNEDIDELDEVITLDVDPSKCVIRHIEKTFRHVRIQSKIKLILDLYDIRGERIHHGGVGVKCFISPKGQIMQSDDALEIIDCSDGSYAMQCQLPDDPGEFVLQCFVSLNGTYIALTSYDFTVANAILNGTIGTRGNGAGQYTAPHGMCAYEGMLYICDAQNKRVQVFRLDGTYVQSIGKKILSHPTGICCYNRLLYVHDAGEPRVTIFSLDGSRVQSIKGRSLNVYGTYHSSQHRNLDGICCYDGLLYLSNSYDCRVLVYQLDGTQVGSIGVGSGGQSSSIPQGICCYKGLLYVCDSNNCRVQIVGLDGSSKGTICGAATDIWNSAYPVDICFYEGLLYVSVARRNSTGICGLEVFKLDGSHVKSFRDLERMNPTGICCYDGLLYVSDSTNHAVKVITL